MRTFEVTEDSRSMDEIYSSILNKRAVYGEKIALQISTIDHVPVPNRIHRVTVFSQEEIGSRDRSVRGTIKWGLYELGYRRLPYVAALLFAEKYDPDELGYNSVLLVHSSAELFGSQGGNLSPHYISLQDSSRPEWHGVTTLRDKHDREAYWALHFGFA
jgi:hypothetical protein